MAKPLENKLLLFVFYYRINQTVLRNPELGFFQSAPAPRIAVLAIAARSNFMPLSFQVPPRGYNARKRKWCRARKSGGEAASHDTL
jgi:hypothetical protein